jgi:multidrug efflux pump subunit AcrB
MIKQSVKKPFAILVAVIIVMMLAAVSLTQMTTDLLPTISTPYLVVITTYPGASPEKVETEVTEPMENALSTVTGVENVTSSSAENYAMIMLEFQEDTDMDAALVKVNIALDTVKDSLPDLCGSPSIMEISMDMMATMYVAVTVDDMDAYQLTDYVNNTLSPYFQRQTGVASVSTLGLVEEMVEVRLNQSKIDALNDRLAAQVEEKLAEAQQQLEEAQAQIDDGKAQLAAGQDQLTATETTQSQALGQLTQQMNQALATQSAYTAILTSQQANQTALEMELDAYASAGVVDAYEQINAAFAALQSSVSGTDGYTQLYDAIHTQALVAAVQSACDEAGLEITVTEDNVEDALAQLDPVAALVARGTAASQAAVAAASQAATLSNSLPTDIADALANPDKLTAAREMLTAAGETEAAQQLTTENLQQLYDIVNTRIPQINTELGNLKVEIAANQAVLDTVNATVQTALDNYADLEAGKISAAAALGAAQAQLTSGEQALAEAQEQLDQAAEEYAAARDAALESANLDQLLTLSTLSALIYAQNFSMPAGYIDDADGNQWLLKVGDELTSVEELEDLMLTRVDGLGDITLADVADITLVDNADDSYTRMNGQDSVLLSIYKASTAGTSAVSKTCNAAIAELEERNPEVHVTVLMDQGDYIKLFINSIVSNIVVGALLAVLVLALFLRSVKPTLVVAFAIPFSVLVAILLMYFTGITLNIMSMSGLALGIGMLVDNSIVVIENIYRLRGRGIPAPRASVQGAKQVAGAIIASTLTTVCVFVPMIFTSGMVRELMVPFALTISFALLASLVVALTVVPTLGSVLLHRDAPRRNPLLDWIQTRYGAALGFCLRHKYVPLSLAVVLLAFCIFAVGRMGIVVIPDMNSDQLYLQVTMDEDLELADCYDKADEITDLLLQVEGVDQVGAMTNMSGLISSSLSVGGNDYRNYTYYLVLDEDIDTVEEVNAAGTRIEAAMANVTGCTAALDASSAGDMSALMSSGLTINLYGQDAQTLSDIARDIKGLVEQVQGFSDVSDGQEEADQVIHLDIDKDEAMALGLTVAQIYSELANRLNTSATAATITLSDQEVEVDVVDENHLLTVDNLLDMTFDTTTMDADGNTVNETHSLREFATLTYTDGLTSISRENGVHTMSVTATTMDGYNTTRLSQQVQEKLDDYDMPYGYSAEISGEVEQVNDMLTQMMKLMALGLVLVYLVMVAQFQSLLSPFIILFTVPLAFTGGLLGLLISGDQLSMVSLLGFLVLMGTVVNNGIVFVDYTNQLRLGGLEKHAALIATGKARLRPILMTALTTILSMSTMMFSRDVTASLSRSMAVVVAGGLAYATLMTLFIVPVMYDIFYRRTPKVVDVGDDLDEEPDDAAEYLAQLQATK